MADTMDESEIKEYNGVFKMFDTDSDGSVTIAELRSLMRYCGYDLTVDVLQTLMSEVSLGENEYVDFPQFLTLLVRKQKEAGTAQEVVEAFRVFDKNSNGFISAAELRLVMTTLGEKLSDEEANEMIREADINGDGQINYLDFVATMFSNVKDGKIKFKVKKG